MTRPRRMLTAAGFFFGLAVLVLLFACGGPSTVDPTGDNERFILDETQRFALILMGHTVPAFISDEKVLVECSDGSRCPAAGWYSGGKIYYWRPKVNVETPRYCTSLAAHEVCHAFLGHKTESVEVEVAADRCAAGLN